MPWVWDKQHARGGGGRGLGRQSLRLPHPHPGTALVSPPAPAVWGWPSWGPVGTGVSAPLLVPGAGRGSETGAAVCFLCISQQNEQHGLQCKQLSAAPVGARGCGRRVEAGRFTAGLELPGAPDGPGQAHLQNQAASALLLSIILEVPAAPQSQESRLQGM